MIVHLDLDGVLFDFTGQIERDLDMPRDEISTRAMWSFINRCPSWFEDLPLLPDALDLWMGVASISRANRRILTATGNNYHDVTKQKIKACYKRLPGFEMNIFRSVPRSEDKSLFANECAVLIDDSPRSCDPFNAAGGIAILHTNAADSLAKLRTLY